MNYEYCAGVTYTIKNGDTLYEISRRHGVPLALLLRANPYVDVFSLQAGDTICIPQKTKEELPYPMENPMQSSVEENSGSSVENAMRETVENIDGSAGMQTGGSAGMNGSAGMQGVTSGIDNSAGMQGVMSGIDNSAGMQGVTSGIDNSAGMQGVMSGIGNSTGMRGQMSQTNSSACMKCREGADKNSPADTPGNVSMNNTVGQRVDSEQMDEMLVWSEQANLNREKKGDRPSTEKQWCKYVVKSGDTLGDVLRDMNGDIDEFWERNPITNLYLLPGIAYYVCKK